MLSVSTGDIENQAEIQADFLIDFVGEQRGLDRIRFGEANVIGVNETAQLRRDFDFGAEPVEEHARIHKVRLAFAFCSCANSEPDCRAF